MARPNAHIAVIRLSAMGDVAMTVPVLRAFVKQHPNVRITMVSRPFFEPFFTGIPNLDFFAVDLNKRHKGLLGLARLYADLSSRKIDAIADLHNVLRSKMLRLFFAASGRPAAKIDKGRSEKKALTRAGNKVFRPLKPTVERYADVFRELGFALDLSRPEFPEAGKMTSEILEVTGQKERHWIGIAPFAKHIGKQYPEDLMAETIAKLSENRDYKIFLLGAGSQERERLERFAEGLENVVVIAGKLKLEQELQLMQHLDLMLSMDSGNAHMAAMFGIPTVTLWGATHPYAGFAPFHQPPENALKANRDEYPLLPTSVYGNKIVPGHEDAMRTIPAESIVNKIGEILG